MCITAKKSKKKYCFSSLTKNKCFWNTFKLFFSNNVQSSEILKLAEKDENLITNEEKAPVKLNNFFSNVVINVEIPKFEIFDPLSENIDHPTLKAIGKYGKHSSNSFRIY